MKKYFGAETEKAVINFPNLCGFVDIQFIYCLAVVKKAAAIANLKIGKIPRSNYNPIVAAIDEILDGKFDRQFVTSKIQGGAGTSIHMNLNEVIANRSSEISGRKIHYLDDVNRSQSTNDVVPTALRLYSLRLLNKYLRQLKRLKSSFIKLSQNNKDVVKVGRTHLQDAVPITFGQVFGAYASFVDRDIKRLTEVKKYLQITNLGGTAIGTMVNSSWKYVKIVNRELSDLTKIKFNPAEDLVDLTQNTDIFLHLMKLLEISVVGISRICSDIRLMASGPTAGFGELILPEVQKGSTIMPGKNNPVTYEAINQICIRIIGDSNSASVAALSGQLELNVMLPTIISSISDTFDLLTKGVAKLSESVVVIKVDGKRCKELLNNSFCYMTQEAVEIGYEKAEKIIKDALNVNPL